MKVCQYPYLLSTSNSFVDSVGRKSMVISAWFQISISVKDEFLFHVSLYDSLVMLVDRMVRMVKRPTESSFLVDLCYSAFTQGHLANVCRNDHLVFFLFHESIPTKLEQKNVSIGFAKFIDSHLV